MTARVIVSLKPSILDPQGQTICSALQHLGHAEISAVRQGKAFDIQLAPNTPREKVASVLDQVAREVLSNPVMEEYRVEILD